MGRMERLPQFPDEPDFLGLTEAQSQRLAAERGLQLRLVGDGRSYTMTAEVCPNRVTAEVEGGVIVYAQRY